MIKIHNITTDEIIEREMNAEELAQLKKDQEENAIIAAEKSAKDATKATLLEKLGITSDEAKILFG